MEFVIRKAKTEDISTIWNLGKDIPFFETSEDIITFWPKSVLDDCIDKDDVLILVIEIQNKIFGFIIGNANNSLKKAEVENIFIIPEYRNQGYAKKLLEHLVKELEAKGIENICAMSEDHIADFYEKSNFARGNKYYWMDLALSDRFKK